MFHLLIAGSQRYSLIFDLSNSAARPHAPHVVLQRALKIAVAAAVT